MDSVLEPHWRCPPIRFFPWGGGVWFSVLGSPSSQGWSAWSDRYWPLAVGVQRRSPVPLSIVISRGSYIWGDEPPTSGPRAAMDRTKSKAQKNSPSGNAKKKHEQLKRMEAKSQGATSVENTTSTATSTTSGSFSSNELWWSIMPLTRARRLWSILRDSLEYLVERMKRDELQVSHLRHGLEPLRRLEVPQGLVAATQDAERSLLVLLDSQSQVHLHAEDGWTRGHIQLPIKLTGLVALVGFQHMGQNSGHFFGWGPKGVVVMDKDLQLLSFNSLDPSRIPVCCALLPGMGMVATGEVGGGLSIWEFRGGGHRLVLKNSVPPLPHPPQSGPHALSRIALDTAPHGIFPHCFAISGTDLIVFDLGTCSVVEVRRKLHKTVMSDVVYCEAAEAVVTGSRDSTVKVWEADWQIRSVFVGHRGPVTALAVLPGTSLLLSASQDLTLRTWNLEVAQQVGEVSFRSQSEASRLSQKDQKEMPTFSCNNSENVYYLWPPSHPGAPLLAQGLVFAELWLVRELHHMVATFSCNVKDLQLVPLPQQADHDILPRRLVGTCSDGTVRILTPDGQVITTMLLQPPNEAIATAYCMPREVLLVLTNKGVVLRGNATRCPISVVHRFQPPELPKGQPCCLHLISHVPDLIHANMTWEKTQQYGGEVQRNDFFGTIWEDKNRFLPVLGYTDGMITVFDWHTFRRLFHAEAHNPGSVTIIASNLQTLVTAGTDMTIKMWRIYPYSEESLTLLRTFFCHQPAVALCPVINRLTVAFEDPQRAIYSLVQYTSSDSDQSRYDHHPQDDSTDHITGLCCCSYLKLYASSSLDCTLRIWTEDNKLLRVLHLTTPPESITFCNDKGDLILALGSQLHLLSHRLYLPTSYLVKVLCRKEPFCKPEIILPLTNPELLTPEDLKRLEGLALPTMGMKASVKKEYVEARNKQREIDKACAKLAARDEELQTLAFGRMEPLAHMFVTPELRLEAFHSYLQVIYGNQLDSVSKEEDEALKNPSTSEEKPPVTSLVTKSSLYEKLEQDIDSMFMNGVTPAKNVRIRRRIQKRSQVPLTERILLPSIECNGFFPSHMTQPRPPSTPSKWKLQSIQFPGYIPNSVTLQQLWDKSDLKGLGHLEFLKSESLEIFERELDSIWLPWGTSKKKERAWMKRALGLGSSFKYPEERTTKKPLKFFPRYLFSEDQEELYEDDLLSEEFMTPEFRAHLEYLFGSTDPDIWNKISATMPTALAKELPKFLYSLSVQPWFQKLFPNYKPEECPESFTEEGIARMLLQALEKADWEEGTKILSLLSDLIPKLGHDTRKQLQALLLKLLNKDPPPDLVHKIEKKFVMMALQMLMVVSLGSRDVVLELMSYFLYSPPRCRPALKKLLEQMGLKDPHGFLFKEMISWAEGKNLHSKAALRGRCGQKLECLIKDLKRDMDRSVDYDQGKRKRKTSAWYQEKLNLTELPEFGPEEPQLKPPQSPTSALLKAKSPIPPKTPVMTWRPRGSTTVKPKEIPRRSPRDMPSRLSISTRPSPQPQPPPPLGPEPILKVSPEFPRPGSADQIRLRRTKSEPQWYSSIFEKSLPLKAPEKPLGRSLSAPALLGPAWAPFGEKSVRFAFKAQRREPQPSPIRKDTWISPIDALNYFCEQRLKRHLTRLQLQKALQECKPNSIILQPLDILSTFHSIESRKILRLQEHKDTLGVLDAPRMINYQRSRYGQNLLKRRLKLPLPRVEPIPFPPIWPPPSRPQPPLLLDEALQRFFLPELSQPDSDFG
ncbi:WD repeat-containing protein 97 isoform X5 [Monodelphis domestica]|uniref:WD repeat-containing protein 97 isoform X5 n=1 Tax=Monodelphis domestica TaxID=13616 RepID=UPI0024E1D420|nr:WD repeat-containing protein 97 isoform X5 [Monodelphis domestica]